MTALAAFTNPEDGIGGGIRKIYAVKKSDVASIPAAVAGDVAGDILLAAGIDAVEWDFDRAASSFRNPSVGSGRSKGFMSELIIKLGGTLAARNEVIGGNINSELVLIVKLSNGTWVIMGDVDRGAVMTIPEHTTGESGEADHMQQIQMTHYSSLPCLTYSGTVPIPTGI